MRLTVGRGQTRRGILERQITHTFGHGEMGCRQFASCSMPWVRTRMTMIARPAVGEPTFFGTPWELVCGKSGVRPTLEQSAVRTDLDGDFLVR
jgi:hypothetical protein